MNIRQLETFVAIANLGGYNRAAAQLHVAQSALSRRILQLEREVGTPLLIRSKRGIQLTPAGAVLLERAHDLLGHIRQVEQDMLMEAGSPRGHLTLGLPPSLNRFSSQVLAAIGSRYPGISVKAWVGTSVDLRAMLVSGRLDVAIFAAIERETVLASKLLFRDTLYLIGPPDARLREKVEWSEIAELPLVLTSAPNSVRLLVDAAATRRKCKINVLMEVNDVPLILQLVADGAAYSFLPSSSVEELTKAGRVCSARMPGLTLEWIVANSKEQPLSIAAQRTIEVIEEIVVR